MADLRTMRMMNTTRPPTNAKIISGTPGMTMPTIPCAMLPPIARSAPATGAPDALIANWPGRAMLSVRTARP